MKATEKYPCGKLLMTVVRRSCGERVVAITKAAGARGGTVIPCRGKSDAPLDRLLGADDSPEDVIFTLASDEDAIPILDALRAYEDRTGKHPQGFVVQANVRAIVKQGANLFAENSPLRSEKMNEEGGSVVVCVIVNRGCADDVMDAAGKAGAGGGVILNGRGTAGEKDVEFLGIPLFPEKEIIFILAGPDQSDSILAALKDAPCLTQPGGGIAFAVEAEKVIRLGKITG